MAKAEKDMVRFACTIMWANLHHINDKGMFPSGKFDFQCSNLTPKAVEGLESVGLTVGMNEKKPEYGHFIKCKSNRPFVVYDVDGQIMEDASIVGNGTKAIVTVTPYEYNFKGKKGLSPSTVKIVITELKEFVQEEVDDSNLKVL